MLNLKNLSRQEIIWVCFILGLVVIAWFLDSYLSPKLASTDLNILASIVAKNNDATLYPRDPFLASPQFYTPSYLWLIDQAWRLGGTLETGLALLVIPVLSSYLAGMFILLYRVTKNSGVALGLTVASAHYHHVVGAGIWGVGGSDEMLARITFMATNPFITLILLNLLERPSGYRGAALGLVLGLATNLSPVSGFHFFLLLLAMLCLTLGNSYRGWQTIGAMVIMTMVGASPMTLNYLNNSGKAIDNNVTFEAFRKVIAENYCLFFCPQVAEWHLVNLTLTTTELYGLLWSYVTLFMLFFGGYVWGYQYWPGLVKWGWLGSGLIAVAYAYMLVSFHNTFLFVLVIFYLGYRFQQGSYSSLDSRLIILMSLIVLYSFVGFYFLTTIWQNFEVWSLSSLIINYARSAGFAYLPIYLLAGLGGTALLELLKPKLGQTSLSLTVAIILGLAPGILQQFYRTLPETLIASGLLICLAIIIFLILKQIVWTHKVTCISMVGLVFLLFGPPASWVGNYLPVPARNMFQPLNWQRQLIPDKATAELFAWTTQNTQRDTLFYGCLDHKILTYFQRVTQRSLTHNWKFISFGIIQRAPLVTTYNDYRQLEKACHNAETLIKSAQSRKADYLLVPSKNANIHLPTVCFLNEKYAVFALKPNQCD